MHIVPFDDGIPSPLHNGQAWEEDGLEHPIEMSARLFFTIKLSTRRTFTFSCLHKQLRSQNLYMGRSFNNYDLSTPTAKYILSFYVVGLVFAIVICGIFGAFVWSIFTSCTHLLFWCI